MKSDSCDDFRSRGPISKVRFIKEWNSYFSLDFKKLESCMPKEVFRGEHKGNIVQNE